MFNNAAMSQSKTQSIVRMSANGNHADIYLLGDIGSWWEGTTANDVLYQIRDAELDTITVYLSTMGGTFNDGLPIYNLLRNHKAHVTIKVIGYAVSMGGVIMLAGDTIEAAQNAVIMLHEAQGFCMGSKQDMRAAAAMLETHEKAIIPRFCERLGKSSEEVMALLEATSWYTADEALAAGLIDVITDAVDLDEVDRKIPENSWKFAIEHFGEAPEFFLSRAELALKVKPSLLTQLINKVVGKPARLSTTETKDDEMTPEQLKELKEAQLAAINALGDRLVSALAPKPTETTADEPLIENSAPAPVPTQTAPAPVVPDLSEQLRVANEATAAAGAKVAQLETENKRLAAMPSPHNTYVPESTGAADEQKHDY